MSLCYVGDLTCPIRYRVTFGVTGEGGKKACYNYNNHLDNALVCVVMECKQVGG